MGYMCFGVCRWQVQECVCEKVILNVQDNNLNVLLQAAQEAARVNTYRETMVFILVWRFTFTTNSNLPLCVCLCAGIRRLFSGSSGHVSTVTERLCSFLLDVNGSGENSSFQSVGSLLHGCGTVWLLRWASQCSVLYKQPFKYSINTSRANPIILEYSLKICFIRK